MRETRGRLGRRVLAFVILAGMVLGACGDDDDGGGGADATSAPSSATPTSGGQPATTAADDVDPSGVLRIGHEIATDGGGVQFDPIKVINPAQDWIFAMVYDTLLRETADGVFEPGLASEAEIVDASTISVTLQEGLTFQDGTPLDAEAVKLNLERNKASNNGGAFRMAELSQLQEVVVESPTELTLRLATPVAGSFYNLLAHMESTIVSPAALASSAPIASAPVGAGPFRITSYDNASLIRMEKWDGYFQADEIRLAAVEFVQVPNGPQQINALKSDTIDVATLSASQVDSAAGGDIKTQTVLSPNTMQWISMQCARQPAFQDVRVRQALNYALDKDAINQVLYQGAGEVQQGLWTSDTDYFNPDLEGLYQRDVAKARDLLAQAGHADLALTLMVSTSPEQQRMAEAVQAQWAEAGITAEIVVSQNSTQDYYLDKKADMFITGQSRTWTDKITRNWMPGSIGTTCDPQDAELTAKTTELKGLRRDDPRAVQLWHEIQAFIFENAYGIFGVMGTLSTAWNDARIGNVTWVPDTLGRPQIDVHSVYIKAS